MKQETLSQVAAASPPVSVAGLTLMGMPIAEWVQLITLIYVLGLVIIQLPKIRDAINKLRGKSD
jgi:dolichyl-phosphate-mannose--protein O-mannosyl transferase